MNNGTPRRVVDHLVLTVSSLERSIPLYEAALAPLGFRRLEEFVGEGAVPFGSEESDDFAIREVAQAGGGVHVAFSARTRDEVRAFHEAALSAGARDNGAPGLRPEYHTGYYGAYVLDFDGNNLEAVFHDR